MLGTSPVSKPRSPYPDFGSSLRPVPPVDGRNEISSLLEIIYTSEPRDPKGVDQGQPMPMFKLLAQFVWGYTENDKLYTGLSLTRQQRTGRR